MPFKSLMIANSMAMFVLTVNAAEPKKPQCAPLAMSEMKLTWVAPDVVHNGIPMHIRSFESKDGVQRLLARFRAEWKATSQYPHNAIEYEVGGYKVIAKLLDLCFYTVQVRSLGQGGSQGLLSVSQIQDKNQAPVLGKDFPMLSGSKVATDLVHRDPGKEARTIMLMNQFSTNANADFYRRVLGGDGWNILSDHLVQFKGGNGNGYTITFKRGFNETSMVISRTEGGTSVLVNQVDKP